MGRLVFCIVFVFVCLVAAGQEYGHTECPWDAGDSLYVGWAGWTQAGKPEIWDRYPDAHHIRVVRRGGWRVWDITPEYIVCFDDKEPSCLEMLRRAYLYFAENPDKREFRGRNYLVTVRLIK